MKTTKLVKCPQCGRHFVDQLSPFGLGYVFPVHATDAAHNVARVTCSGSKTPIKLEYREAV